MSADAPALVHMFKVGRFEATLTVPPIAPGTACTAVVEWAPHVPDRLTAEEAGSYQAEMLAAFSRLTSKQGGDAC